MLRLSHLHVNATARARKHRANLKCCHDRGDRATCAHIYGAWVCERSWPSLTAPSQAYTAHLQLQWPKLLSFRAFTAWTFRIQRPDGLLHLVPRNAQHHRGIYEIFILEHHAKESCYFTRSPKSFLSVSFLTFIESCSIFFTKGHPRFRKPSQQTAAEANH